MRVCAGERARVSVYYFEDVAQQEMEASHLWLQDLKYQQSFRQNMLTMNRVCVHICVHWCDK